MLDAVSTGLVAVVVIVLIALALARRFPRFVGALALVVGGGFVNLLVSDELAFDEAREAPIDALVAATVEGASLAMALLASLVSAASRGISWFEGGSPSGPSAPSAPGLPDAIASMGFLRFLAAALVVQFLAGVALIWLTAESTDDRSTPAWLGGIGVVLFAAGVLWTLLGSDAFALTAAQMRTAIVAVLGAQAAGVLVAVLSMRPDFRGRPSGRTDERGRSPGSAERDRSDRGDDRPS